MSNGYSFRCPTRLHPNVNAAAGADVPTRTGLSKTAACPGNSLVLRPAFNVLAVRAVSRQSAAEELPALLAK
jgi:hypothetical protein